MLQSLAEKIDQSIKTIETSFTGGLSNTSTKKFDDLVVVMSELTGYSPDDVYPTSVVKRASNVWNRLSQGKPLNRHFPLAVVIGTRGDEKGVLAPLGSFIGAGNVHYDSVAVVTQDANDVWRISDVATNAVDDCALKIKAEFREVKVHIMNKVQSPDLRVVRLAMFSGLEEKFKEWLPLHGVVVSADKYAHFLRALGEPFDAGAPLPHSGRWPGFYFYMTGKMPSKGVYEVESYDEFLNEYGALKPFFETDEKNPEGFDPVKYDKGFDYTHAAPSQTGIVDKDQRTLLSAYRKYIEFLNTLEQKVNSSGGAVVVSVEGQEYNDPYLAAIRTKPFILLAGISGTGKSRLVRQLAKGCCKADSVLANGNEPGNFASIAVRPNWHDSTELIGYVSRLGTEPRYVITDFVRFLAKAWQYEDVPFFLCLDEMNLAPVEQYFAEYLSVVESRSRAGGKIESDVLIKWADDDIRKRALEELFGEDASPNVTLLKAKIDKDKGLRLPPNLIVMGTVNMDETTFSFSRKVLDRAMSFELNEVDMDAGLQQCNDIEYGSILPDLAQASLIKGCEAYAGDQALCEKVKLYLIAINERLEGTSFKIAYRTRDEMMIYCIERTKGGLVGLTQALDEATSMKILSRIEGDTDRITEAKLTSFRDLIVGELLKIDGKDGTAAEVAAFLGDAEKVKASACCSKLNQMIKTVHDGAGFVSFWQC